MKTNDKVFQIAEEIAFVKVLASNELSLRNRAVKKLRRWIRARTENSKTAFSDDDFLRIWEGLFYSMWMSDKPLIQEECAETISKLIHAFGKEEAALSFIRSFYHMMSNKWSTIDTFRLDKFAMLVRRFTRQSLVFCKKHNWNDKLALDFALFINKPSLPQGLFFHFCDIIIEEICKVADEDLNDEILILFIRPFFKKLAETKNRPLAAYMKETVIKQLIDLTDIADEYREKFKIWHQSGFKGGRIDVIEKVEDPSDSDDDDNTLPLKQGLDTSLDPRPGCVDVMLPVIKIDPDKYLSVLQEIKLEINCKSDNLSKLFTKFSQLKKGEYPYGIKKVRRGPSLKADMDAAVERMVQEKLNGETEVEDEEREEIDMVKQRKMMKRTLNPVDVDDIGDIVAGKRGHWSITQSVKPKVEKSESSNSSLLDEWNISHVNNKKLSQKKGKFTTDTIQKWHVESTSKKSNTTFSLKQNLNMLKDSGECWWRVSTVEEQALNGNDLGIENKNSPTQQNSKRKANKSNSHNTETSGNVLYNGEPLVSVTTVPSKLKHLSTPNQNTVAYPSMKQKGNLPIDDVNITPLRPQNARVSELKTPASGKRCLSIRLDMNTSQDVEDHWATIASNPVVPIEDKPVLGILKPSPIPSPINPFYGKRRMRSNLIL